MQKPGFSDRLRNRADPHRHLTAVAAETLFELRALRHRRRLRRRRPPQLHSNPFHCDCRLLDFAHWVQQAGVPRTVEPTCALPRRLQNRRVLLDTFAEGGTSVKTWLDRAEGFSRGNATETLHIILYANTSKT